MAPQLDSIAGFKPARKSTAGAGSQSRLEHVANEALARGLGLACFALKFLITFAETLRTNQPDLTTAFMKAALIKRLTQRPLWV